MSSTQDDIEHFLLALRCVEGEIRGRTFACREDTDQHFQCSHCSFNAPSIIKYIEFLIPVNGVMSSHESSLAKRTKWEEPSISHSMTEHQIMPSVEFQALIYKAAQHIQCYNEHYSKTERHEGYWATHPDLLKDKYYGIYPFPEASETKWQGQEAFKEKLASIQKLPATTTHSYMGCSYSRITGERLGSREYELQVGDINWCWPYDYLPHYIQKYNIQPSKEFYDMVMNYNPSSE